MKRLLGIFICAALISTIGCRSCPPVVAVPLGEAPERPLLVGDAERDAVALIIVDLRWRIWEAYAREANGEISKEERVATVARILDSIEQIARDPRAKE